MTARDQAERGRRAEQIRRDFWADASSGWVMAVELVTGTFLWGGIGWLLDRWLHTAPWLMAAGFLLGYGTAFYLVYLRATGRLAAPRTRGERTELDETRGPR